MRTLSLLAVLIVSSALATPVVAAMKPNLLMLDITPHGVPPEVTRSLTDLLELEIERGGLYSVISQQDLRTLIKVEEQKLLLGKDEESQQQLAKIAESVDAPLLLGSSLGRVGKAYLLSLELLDVKQVKVVRRVSQTLVGQPEDLVGSLRAAVLAITLEEKGVTPDISEELIDKLKIAEKPKSVFITLGPAWESPLGTQTDEDSSLLVLRPDFLHVRVEAELPVMSWLRLFGSLSVGNTINAHQHSEFNNVGAQFDGSDAQTSVYQQGATVGVDYSALWIPFNVGVKVVPESGRFLPYALVALGASWQKYSFSDSTMGAFRELSGTACPEPFERDTPTSGLGSDFCVIDDIVLNPAEEFSAFGLDLVGAGGFEFLFSHHLGFKVEARYHFAYLFGSEGDFRLQFNGEKQLTDGTIRSGHLVGIQQVHHGLVFSASAIVYW